MNRLLIELYPLIFQYLDIHQLFSCKLVNKKFNQAVRDFKVKELSFSTYRGCWSFNSRPISNQAYLDASKISILKNPIDNFSHLRCLLLPANNVDIHLNDINKFSRLELLLIDLYRYEDDVHKTIALPKLKVLHIYPSKSTEIELDTPMLHSLRCHCSKIDMMNYVRYQAKLKFKYPQELKRLIMETPVPLFEHFEDLSIFTNLSLLQTDCSTGYDQTIASLPGLKEIRLQKDWFIGHNLDDLKDLLKQRLVQRRLELKIYLMGILLDHDVVDQFTQEKDRLTLKVRHYEKLAKNLAVTSIDYNRLIELIRAKFSTPRLPGDFTEKFSKIQEITVTAKIENESGLIELIKNCQCLNELQLKNSNLGQNFYEQLPSVCSINYLTILEDGNAGLNFDFIGRMYFLRKFTTDQELSLSTITKLRPLPYFYQLEFKFGREKYFIQQLRRGKYDLYKKFYKFIKTETTLEQITKLMEFEYKKARIVRENYLFGS